MDNQHHIDQLFQKFIDNTITKKEYEVLMNLIKDPNSENRIKEVMDTHWRSIDASGKKKTSKEEGALLELVMNKVEHMEKMEKPQRNLKPKWMISTNSIYRIAASVVIMLGLFYGYQNGLFFKSAPSDNSLPDSNAITLKLDNGNIEVVSENEQRKISDVDGNVVGIQKGNQIDYNTERPKLKELVYNELTVPYGKRFDLVLSDGTKVKINAGTTIKYPVQFITGQNRKVFVKGEAYFDVTEDIAHPFVVNANDINVEVLGTEFNVSSYPEDLAVNTVLVEGSVKIYDKYKEQNPESHNFAHPWKYG